MATPSSIFTQMVTATDRNWGKSVTDNVSAHNGLLTRLKSKGKIKTFSGGYEIAEPLEYAEGGNYQRYSGYDEMTTQAVEILTSAKYPLQQVALNVVSSGKEIRMNMGEERMINLVKQKKANALRSAANNFSIDLYSDGALTNQINGLANLIQTDGGGTVGGIVSTTWTFWKNKFREATGTNTAATPTLANSTQFLGDLNALFLSLVRGADKPDLGVFTHDFYSLYEVSQQDKQRYTDSDLAKAGFETLKYKSLDIIFDSNTNFTTTGERGYFLNTDYLYLKQHSEAKWTADDEKRPANQDAVIVPIYWMGNLVCTNRSLQGIIFDAT